ncbi:fimbrillin family protein, partial [uncultured Prevotella sp.]|uniref:fimbrillin family protein n=1 Tax=uncultured Prevotella sp. TaxID=159272 RepID=UPI0027E2F33D
FTAPTEYGEWGSLTFDNKIGETDLIYATKDCGLYSGGECPAPVNLTFDHLLSRVRFQFTNGMDDGSDVHVTDVKITNAYANGTAILAASIDAVVWTTSNPQDLVFGNMTGKVDDKTGRSDHKYMIPTTTATNYTISFKVTRVHHGVTDVYNHTATVSLALQPNKSYQLTATLDKNNINPDDTLCPIEFAVSVNSWGNFTDTGITM